MKKKPKQNKKSTKKKYPKQKNPNKMKQNLQGKKKTKNQN